MPAKKKNTVAARKKKKAAKRQGQNNNSKKTSNAPTPSESVLQQVQVAQPTAAATTTTATTPVASSTTTVEDVAANVSGAKASPEEIEAMMAAMEEELEAIVEDDDEFEEDFRNKALRMRTPAQCSEQTSAAEKKPMTVAQTRRALKQRIKAMSADRAPLRDEQRMKDSKGNVMRGGVRMTTSLMKKAQAGHCMGVSGKGNSGAKKPTDNGMTADDLSPEQLEAINEMMKNNPHLLAAANQ